MDVEEEYSTDSSEARERDAKKAIVESVEEEDLPPIPTYTDEEMKQLITFIIQMVTIFDMNEDDVTEKFCEILKNWILNVNEKFLFVYYDGIYLSASYTMPVNPVFDLTYFIRDELGLVFTVEGFHDEVTFGTIHENVEETILTLISRIYAPRILKDKRWDENIKSNLFVELHSFLAHLTDINSKIGSMVVLYIPNESHDMSVEDAVKDKQLVKRLESVVIYWISQIRLCLNDMENLIQNELTCALDEYEFWIYKHEVLSGIEEQIKHSDIQHILNVLEKSQSLFIKQFKNLMDELSKELSKSKSNAAFLNLLVGPCADLEESELPSDVPAKLPKIIYLIRIISLKSDYYKSKQNTERLFAYLSNEIIKFCKAKVDLNKIFTGNPRFGIKICDMAIDCCLSYKLIFKRLKEQFNLEDFRRTWLFDDTNIFNQINIFIQRLYDIMEICETIIVFGRVDESMTIPPLNFGCYNAKEFLIICKDIEQKFENGLKKIKNCSDMILNVHNRMWYHEISAFKILIRSLEEVLENLFSQVFLSIDNIEEALDVLTALYNFSKRKNLQNEYIRRVNQMWKMFEEEITIVNKEISRSDSERPSCLPKYSGKSFLLKIRLNKIERLRDLLLNAHYLPHVPSRDENLRMLETTINNINTRIEKYNNDWIDNVHTQPSVYLQRCLINRSSTHAGLLECNIDRNILPIFEEAKYFDFMEIPLPSALIPIYPKADRVSMIYNKVVNVVLLYNRILYCLSEKERLLFKPLIMAMDKKVGLGMWKLTYNDEVTDVYIMDCLKHLDELQKFVDIYKIINFVNIKLFEVMCNDKILAIKSKSPYKLEEFKSKLKDAKTTSIQRLVENYRKIINYMIVIYDGFDSCINEMMDKWIDYIKKFDLLAEFAMLTCCKNTLNGFYYLLHGKNNMSPDPIISLNVNLKNQVIVFEPEIEEIMSNIVNIHADIIKCIKVFPRLMDHFSLPKSRDIKNFHEVFEMNNDCTKIYSDIKEVIRDNIDSISVYIENWHLFRSIWEVDIDQFVEKYKEIGIKLNDFESSMGKYFDVSNQVLMQDTVSTINFLTLDCSKLKHEVLEYITKWKRCYKDILRHTSKQKIHALYNYLEENVEKLHIKPYNIQQLEDSLKLHEKCLGELKEKMAEMEEIKKYFQTLEKYDIDVTTDMHDKFMGMDKKWEWYNAKLKEVDESLYNLKEQFKMGLLSDAKELKEEIQTLEDTVHEQIPTSAEYSSIEAQVILNKCYKRLQNLIDRQEKYNDQTPSFRLPVVIHPELKKIKTEFDLIQDVWDLVAEWEYLWFSYELTAILKIDYEALENDVSKLSRKVNKSFEIYKDRNWEILDKVKQLLDNLKKSLPLIQDLSNPVLVERHWNAIRQLCDSDFDENSSSFNLKMIIDLNLQKFVDEVRDISNSAVMETQIENNISNIIETWKGLTIDIVPYKVEQWKIQNVDDCFQALEEHTVLISNMKSTRFVEPFRDLVNEWETKLSYVSEILENLLLVQRKWIYLDDIFQGEDIKKDMKKEVQSFSIITEDFQNIVKNMKQQKLIVDATHYKKPSVLLKDINRLNTDLEIIQRALELYLETKRNIFPRFYFISNDDLLEILGNSKRPNLNQIHMKKLFDNVNKLQLNEIKTQSNVIKYQALGMSSADGEQVPFATPVNLDGSVEQYLTQFEKKMRLTMKEFLLKTMRDLKKTDLDQRYNWVNTHPGQLCIMVGGIQFTAETGNTLDICKMLNIIKPLKSLKKKQKKLLMKLAEISRKNLDTIMRLKSNAMITIEIHNRDILEKMYNAGCKDPSDFEWFSQLKFYWDSDIKDCVIRQTNTEFIYGYEYTGNSGRLVITPLTDRVYITLTTALHLTRGGSLQGPAGTGKTETTKDLAKALGLWAIITNCSEGLDYKSVGKIFSGLCQSGFWGLFDEFNRMSSEVLSVVAQQVLSILSALSAKQDRLIFEGNDIRLVHSIGMFITMNPGYTGTSELPDNLKSMFRPISVMVPDNIIIAENLLFSDGFENASVLAKKVITLYDLCKLQLSKQLHYDFGLRSMVSLLRYAGKKKRENPNIPENDIVLLAMRDNNLAKLTYDDLPLFNSIIKDIFPTTEIPSLQYKELSKAILLEIEASNLQKLPATIEKVIQLFETKASRHSVMLLGETNTGKSTIWNLLKRSLNRLKSTNTAGFQNVHEYIINSKAVTLGELYGEYDLSTGMEWNDGVVSAIMRKICSEESLDEKWVVFDSPVDAVLIEMNSLMDDSKLLTLINGERISMPSQITLFFEADDLTMASPATISRCGMIYMDYQDLTWRPYIDSWLSGKSKETKKTLGILIEEYLQLILDFKAKNCPEIIPSNELNLIKTFCTLWDCLSVQENGINIDQPGLLESVGKMLFFFCIVWSVCALIDGDGRRKIDFFIREKEGIFPMKDTVYDYYVDFEKRTLIGWEAMINENWRYEKNLPFYKILVPTNDTMRYGYLLSNLLRKKTPILLVGGVGNGKTSLAKNSFQQLDPNKVKVLTINMSAQTTSTILQETIESRMERRTKNVYHPLQGKELLIFIDDFNMPAKDCYGSQPTLELLRQWIDYGFWYDRERQIQKFMEKISLMAAMSPPSGGRQPVSPRVLNKFAIYNIATPTDNTINQMFNKIMAQHFEEFPKEVRSMGVPLVRTTVEFYNEIVVKMLPTPKKIHYLFNMRDVSKVVEGLVQSKPDYHKDKTMILKLWVHECQRVFSDRLVEENDVLWLDQRINDKLIRNFNSSMENVAPEPLLFGDFKNPLEIYENLDDWDSLMEVLFVKLNDYNSLANVVKMDLIFFKDAVNHLVRIIRAISYGHLLIVGLAGSGRQSLCKLASFIAEMGVFQIKTTEKYKLVDFKEDLKTLFKLTGVKDKSMIFLLNDFQLRNELFYEVINNILSTGEVTNLFKIDEVDELKMELAKRDPSLKDLQSTEEINSVIFERSKVNLHIVMIMSPGKSFAAKIQQYPALISCTTIDWFSEWTENSYFEVSKIYFENLKKEGEVMIVKSNDDAESETPVDLYESLSIAVANIHLSVLEHSKKMMASMKRITYITPSSFLELLINFIKLLAQKRLEISNEIEKFKNGLFKIQDTSNRIQILSEELQVNGEKIQQFTEECDNFLEEIEIKTKLADTEKQTVSEQKIIIGKEAAKVEILKQQTEIDLQKAMPAFEAAISALDSLNKKDLTEIKSYVTPPAKVERVMEAVMILIGRPTNWAESKRKLGEQNFLEDLKNFDKNNVADKTLRRIEKYTNDPELEPEKVGIVSLAAKSLCLWVRAIENYGRIWRIVGPKQEKLRELEANLLEKETNLKEAEDKLQILAETLKKLGEDYEDKMTTKNNLQVQAKTLYKKLERAEMLVQSLTGERKRWMEAEQELSENYGLLIGDCLLSTAFSCYLGPFTSAYRESMMKFWSSEVYRRSLPTSDEFNPINFLSDSSVIHEWNMQGLPVDSFNSENGVLVANSEKWPVLIDPETQAFNWLRNKEGKSMKITEFSSPDFANALERAIFNGTAILIQNISEEFPAILLPILNKSIVRQGGLEMIEFNDKMIDYNHNFRLYFLTRIGNPHFAPEIFTKTKIINFSIKEEGLEEQLLGILVQKEKPSLEEQKVTLVVNIAKHRKTLKDLETEILQMLNEDRGPILDDEKFFDTLQNSKQTSLVVKESLNVAETTEIEINLVREEYRPSAHLASILYFVLRDLSNIDPMYQFSLNFYNSLFVQSIENSEKYQQFEQRIKAINDYHTLQFYRNTCLGLFEKHKLLFSFYLAVKILNISKVSLDSQHYSFLLKGGIVLDREEQPLNPAPAWISEEMWDNLTELEKLHGFNGLLESFEKSHREWKEWYLLKEPEGRPMIGNWHEDLNDFQKLILIRCLRLDRVIPCMIQFVMRVLGKEFVEPPVLDLKEIFNKSQSNIPLIFVLSQGVDPTPGLLQLAVKQKMQSKFKTLSLGQGQSTIATQLVTQGMKAGHWVFLANCHLSLSWMPDLEQIVEQIQFGKIHKRFRLWLSSSPHPDFPISILQNSTKITTEPPNGIKPNMKRLYGLITSEKFEACKAAEKYQKLLFALSFFNSILIERKKFGQLGWNSIYTFNDSDFEVSETILSHYLDEYDQTPWDVLKYLIGEINYGGHITDSLDKRLLITYSEDVFNDSVLNVKNFKLSGAGDYYIPSEGTLDYFKEFIDGLPNTDVPEIFGQNQNAEITSLISESRDIFKNLLLLENEQSADGDSEENKEEMVYQIAQDILTSMPKRLNYEQTKKKFGRNLTPLDIVLLQEIARYNSLLRSMESDLKILLKCIRGLSVLTDSLEKVLISLSTGTVPVSWMKTYPSLKPLGSWTRDLSMRVEFFERWAEKGVAPVSFWLSAFSFPASFLTSVLQRSARALKIPIDSLNWEYEVLVENEVYGKPAENGAYVRGLFLEGGSWDRELGCLQEPKLLELIFPMPIILFKTSNIPKKKSRRKYECPAYYYPIRASRGQVHSYVTSIDLNTGSKDSNFWIKRGTAILLNLSN